MNKSIPLMLDSSVYKQVPKLNSQLFEEIVKCTRAGIYKLYISEVVEKEFISWIRNEAQSAFDTVAKATQSLNKYYEEPSIFGINLVFNSTALVAERQINEILKKVVNNWNDFKRKTNATVIPIRDDHGRLVMDAYFEGGKPFNKIKNRIDIPDAFIYCSIKELLNNNETVVFVTSDKKFSKNIQDGNILCFGSISDLFSFGPAKLDSGYFNSLSVNDKASVLFRIYRDEIYKKLVREIELSELVDSLAENLIDFAIGEYSDISTEVDDLKFINNEIKNISSMSILVPFSAKVIFSVKSISTKEDLFVLGDQRLKNIDKEADDNGDFKVCEKHQSSVLGNFSIAFSDTDPSTWKEEKLSDNVWSTPEINEISVSLEDVRVDA